MNLSKTALRKATLRQAILDRGGNVCFVCRQPMVLDPPRNPARPRHPLKIPDMATFEHIVEVVNGGNWALGNLALSHLRCNMQRSRLNLFVKRFGEQAGSRKQKWLMPAWPALPLEGPYA